MPSRQARSQARDRAAKRPGQCAEPWCPEQAAPGKAKCPRHLAADAARSAAHHARHRTERNARRRARRKAG